MYAAQIVDGQVSQVIVADNLEWATEHLGGVWAETADPYSEEPQDLTYCGPGWGYDETWPSSFAPVWQQPIGSEDAYPTDSLVWHNGRIWQSTTSANVHEPGVSGWRDTPPSGVAVWVQPAGAHDAYQMNDVVSHNQQVWVSTHNSNVWEPGVFGWVVQ